MAGFTSLVVTLLLGMARANRLFRDGAPVPPEIEEKVAGIAHDLALQGPVELRVSARVPVPVTWGLRRPRVLLPTCARLWPSPRLRRVMLHELAHVKRRDWATGVVAELARCVHWFNPLVWIALHQVRSERERACDDQVLVSGAKPSDYAQDLRNTLNKPNESHEHGHAATMEGMEGDAEAEDAASHEHSGADHGSSRD